MNYNFPIAFFDPPVVLDCTVTPIPGSGGSPLQVIAATGPKSGIGLDYIDTTGEFIGVYLGAAGHEVLLCVIGNGLTSRGWGVIQQNSRVSLRAIAATPITNGKLQATVMSYSL